MTLKIGYPRYSACRCEQGIFEIIQYSENEIKHFLNGKELNLVDGDFEPIYVKIERRMVFKVV